MTAGAVVVTDAQGSFPGLSDALRALGVEVIELPLLTWGKRISLAVEDAHT